MYEVKGKVKVSRTAVVDSVLVASDTIYARAQHGSGSPIDLGINPLPGMLYVNETDHTLWFASGGQWRVLSS